MWLSIWGGGGVHWVQVVGCSCYFADVSKNGQNPLLSSLCCFCSWCVACKYGSIWLFKGVFSGFCGADVCLYGLRSLRGLWGFCVLEMFGGFGACGDFLHNISFCPFLSFSSLVLFCPLLCSFRPAFVACFLSCSWSACLGLCCWLSFPSDGIRYEKRGAFSASLPRSVVLLLSDCHINYISVFIQSFVISSTNKYIFQIEKGVFCVHLVKSQP